MRIIQFEQIQLFSTVEIVFWRKAEYLFNVMKGLNVNKTQDKLNQSR